MARPRFRMLESVRDHAAPGSRRPARARWCVTATPSTSPAGRRGVERQIGTPGRRRGRGGARARARQSGGRAGARAGGGPRPRRRPCRWASPRPARVHPGPASAKPPPFSTRLSRRTTARSAERARSRACYIMAGATACARGALGRAEHLLEHGIAIADNGRTPRTRGVAGVRHRLPRPCGGRPRAPRTGGRRLPARRCSCTPRRATRPARRGRATTSACSPGDGRTRRRRPGTCVPRSTASGGSATGGPPRARRGRYGTVEIRHADTSPRRRRCSTRPSTVSAARRPPRRGAVPGGGGRGRGGAGQATRAARLLGAAGARPGPAGRPAARGGPRRAAALDARTRRRARPARLRPREGHRAALDERRRAGPRGAAGAPTDLAALTAREREVARLVATGRTDRQIARISASPSGRCTCTSATPSASSARAAARASRHRVASR